MFAKIAKNIILAVQAHFLTFQKMKKTTPDFIGEKPKTGLAFEIRQLQQKFQRRPTLQSMANPAVGKPHPKRL